MSKTDENLKVAFAGESQARNKYTYFAKVARDEKYFYVAKIFEETAENEMQHAKNEFKLLNGIKSTKDNLKEAIKGEHFESSEMYVQFEKEALKEKRLIEAKLFYEIAEVEKKHERRYKYLLDLLEKNKLYQRDKPIKWKCSKCGYEYTGTKPPTLCPSCKHAKEYYEPEDIF